MAITKMSNLGIASLGSEKYNDMLAGNPPFIPRATNYESIATLTLSSNSTTATFSSIPNTYQSLQIRLIGKAASVANFGGIFGIRFNGDTNVNYSYAGWNSAASAPAAMKATGETSMNWQGVIPLNGASITNMWGVAIVDINNYTSTSLQKSLKTIGGWCGRNIDIGYTTQSSGLWANTSVVDSITFVHSNTWLAGSQFALYGIKVS
jgi:hypothetical protein